MSKLDKAVNAFRANVQEEYELDTEVVDRLCVFFRNNVSGLTVADKAEKTDKVEKTDKAPKKGAVKKTAEKVAVPETPKTVRKKSAYNVYVREMMKTPAVSALNHRDKMCAIATLWKAMTDADKVKYTQMAVECNDTESVSATIVTVA
jgi:hypothetical protein